MSINRLTLHSLLFLIVAMARIAVCSGQDAMDSNPRISIIATNSPYFPFFVVCNNSSLSDQNVYAKCSIRLYENSPGQSDINDLSVMPELRNNECDVRISSICGVSEKLIFISEPYTDSTLPKLISVKCKYSIKQDEHVTSMLSLATVYDVKSEEHLLLIKLNKLMQSESFWSDPCASSHFLLRNKIDLRVIERLLSGKRIINSDEIDILELVKLLLTSGTIFSEFGHGRNRETVTNAQVFASVNNSVLRLMASKNRVVTAHANGIRVFNLAIAGKFVEAKRECSTCVAFIIM